jgi:hypothetical protein
MHEDSFQGHDCACLAEGDPVRFDRLLALLVVFSRVLRSAQKAKEQDLSAAMMNARYIYVETEGGGDITSPGADPEDRQAISNVESGIKQWNRYAIAMRVRKGRLVGVQCHATILPAPVLVRLRRPRLPVRG